MSKVDIIQLLERHRWHIERVCMRASYGDEAVCADMVRECYTTIWRRQGSLPLGAGAFAERSWVYWQCRSTVAQHRRRWGRWLPIDDRLAETLAATDDTAARELLEELVVGLDTPLKTLLDYILEGYSNDEIAEMTGFDLARVKSMRRRLIKRLRQTYEEIINKK